MMVSSGISPAAPSPMVTNRIKMFEEKTPTSIEKSNATTRSRRLASASTYRRARMSSNATAPQQNERKTSKDSGKTALEWPDEMEDFNEPPRSQKLSDRLAAVKKEPNFTPAPLGETSDPRPRSPRKWNRRVSNLPQKARAYEMAVNTNKKVEPPTTSTPSTRLRSSRYNQSVAWPDENDPAKGDENSTPADSASARKISGRLSKVRHLKPRHYSTDSRSRDGSRDGSSSSAVRTASNETPTKLPRNKQGETKAGRNNLRDTSITKAPTLRKPASLPEKKITTDSTKNNSIAKTPTLRKPISLTEKKDATAYALAVRERAVSSGQHRTNQALKRSLGDASVILEEEKASSVGSGSSSNKSSLSTDELSSIAYRAFHASREDKPRQRVNARSKLMKQRRLVASKSEGQQSKPSVSAQYTEHKSEQLDELPQEGESICDAKSDAMSNASDPSTISAASQTSSSYGGRGRLSRAALFSAAKRRTASRTLPATKEDNDGTVTSQGPEKDASSKTTLDTRSSTESSEVNRFKKYSRFASSYHSSIKKPEDDASLTSSKDSRSNQVKDIPKTLPNGVPSQIVHRNKKSKRSATTGDENCSASSAKDEQVGKSRYRNSLLTAAQKSWSPSPSFKQFITEDTSIYDEASKSHGTKSTKFSLPKKFTDQPPEVDDASTVYSDADHSFVTRHTDDGMTVDSTSTWRTRKSAVSTALSAEIVKEVSSEPVDEQEEKKDEESGKVQEFGSSLSDPKGAPFLTTRTMSTVSTPKAGNHAPEPTPSTVSTPRITNTANYPVRSRRSAHPAFRGRFSSSLSSHQSQAEGSVSSSSESNQSSRNGNLSYVIKTNSLRRNERLRDAEKTADSKIQSPSSAFISPSKAAHEDGVLKTASPKIAALAKMHTSRVFAALDCEGQSQNSREVNWEDNYQASFEKARQKQDPEGDRVSPTSIESSSSSSTSEESDPVRLDPPPYRREASDDDEPEHDICQTSTATSESTEDEQREQNKGKEEEDEEEPQAMVQPSSNQDKNMDCIMPRNFAQFSSRGSNFISSPSSYQETGQQAAFTSDALHDPLHDPLQFPLSQEAFLDPHDDCDNLSTIGHSQSTDEDDLSSGLPNHLYNSPSEETANSNQYIPTAGNARMVKDTPSESDSFQYSESQLSGYSHDHVPHPTPPPPPPPPLPPSRSGGSLLLDNEEEKIQNFATSSDNLETDPSYELLTDNALNSTMEKMDAVQREILAAAPEKPTNITSNRRDDGGLTTIDSPSAIWSKSSDTRSLQHSKLSTASSEPVQVQNKPASTNPAKSENTLEGVVQLERELPTASLDSTKESDSEKIDETKVRAQHKQNIETSSSAEGSIFSGLDEEPKRTAMTSNIDTTVPEAMGDRAKQTSNKIASADSGFVDDDVFVGVAHSTDSKDKRVQPSRLSQPDREDLAPQPPPPPPPPPSDEDHLGSLLDSSKVDTVNSDLTSSMLAGEGNRINYDPSKKKIGPKTVLTLIPSRQTDSLSETSSGWNQSPSEFQKDSSTNKSNDIEESEVEIAEDVSPVPQSSSFESGDLVLKNRSTSSGERSQRQSIGVVSKESQRIHKEEIEREHLEKEKGRLEQERSAKEKRLNEALRRRAEEAEEDEIRTKAESIENSLFAGKSGDTEDETVPEPPQPKVQQPNGMFAKLGCSLMDIGNKMCQVGGQPFDRNDDIALIESNEGESMGSVYSNAQPIISASFSLTEHEKSRWDDWDRRDERSGAPFAPGGPGHFSSSGSKMDAFTAVDTMGESSEDIQARHEQAHLRLLDYSKSALSLTSTDATETSGDQVTTSGSGTTDSGTSAVRSVRSGPSTEEGSLQESSEESPTLREDSNTEKNEAHDDNVAAPSALSTTQRRVLEKFCATLKSHGVEVLKQNRDTKWQIRFITISSETRELQHVRNGENLAAMIKCPLAVLWLKSFKSEKNYSVGSIDRQGRGGVHLSQLLNVSAAGRSDQPSIPKKFQSKYNDSVAVLVEYLLQGSVRTMTLRCKTTDEAHFLCAGLRVCIDVMRRETNLAGQSGPGLCEA